MSKNLPLLRRIELTLGGLKFAVIIILVFATCLIFGTFMESYHGTEYANRLVYKSPLFMAVQALIFLSIFFATTLRLPYKKRLAGFYVIHLGLLTLFIGSFITYYSGVDGSMALNPRTPEKVLTINDDQIVMRFAQKGKQVIYDLPYSATEKNIDQTFEAYKLGRYLPFAKEQLTWVNDIQEQKSEVSSAHYKVANANVAQEFTLSLHELSDFQSTTSMGPLNVHYLPRSMSECFAEAEKTKLIIWNSELDQCQTPEELGLAVKTSPKHGRYLVMPFEHGKLTFYPDFAPLPVTDDLKVVEGSPYRIFSQKLFETKPNLFLFGDRASFYLKDEQKWVVKNLEKNQALALPWMGFELSLLTYSTTSYPVNLPVYQKPIQDNGQVVVGNLKAQEIIVAGKSYWVKSERPVKINHQGEVVEVSLENKSLTLPYQITLKNFKMDKDPGTNNPASYESFVQVFTKNGGVDHHLYMNHPMKLENFTFYQASYFEVAENIFGSVLSVNYDPGRFLKYLGSILLVLGSIWHFILRSKPKKSVSHA